MHICASRFLFFLELDRWISAAVDVAAAMSDLGAGSGADPRATRSRRISWGKSHVREHAVETVEGEDGTYLKTLAWDTVGEYITVRESIEDKRRRREGRGSHEDGRAGIPGEWVGIMKVARAFVLR
jgi:hypothetical protein